MNERIKELALQAENYAAEQNDKFGVSYKKTYNEKFAQLIVEECMRMCDVAQVGYLTHGHTLQGEGCQGAKRYISDWFEVEE
jgi:hypothetical protein